MQFRDGFSATHKVLLLLSMVVITVAFFSTPESSQAVLIPELVQPESGFAIPMVGDMVIEEPGREASQSQVPPAPIQPLTERYEIQPGDTLSRIFEGKGIPATVLHRLLEADVEYLSLETIRPGTMLTFVYNLQGALEDLALEVDPARTITFSRQGDGSFLYQKTEADTYWSPALISGVIRGSFYASGIEAGLTEGQVVEIGHLLKNQIDFRRSLRAGDTFSVVVAREMTGEEFTGNTQIDSVSLHRGKRTYNAFLYDGSYYDETGESITLAFRRWPTSKPYRVSSPFNGHRLHPVTGRKAPHNGVDLAVPYGTKVLSTGDGVISRVGNHPYAGRYVDINHSGSYTTRYLHLSKVLVKRGERVKRGQTIALSGNSGRTTGAHLHFEFHISGRPVNPLTANIPTSANVPENKLASFKAQVSKQLAMMQVQEKSGSMYAEAATGAAVH
ncbi:MAG TPA: peptidoglycan DD-metalloendopeptidase family protein [Marinobacter sp.]|nr:peptidoglycan DD-metalloendopeptidase family protein [Marinobacter sp.]